MVWRGSATTCTKITRSEAATRALIGDRARIAVPEGGEIVVVLGVVVAQQAVGEEGAEHPLSQQPLEFGGVIRRFRPVGGDQGHIVDAGLRGPGQHRFDHRGPDIGPPHLRHRLVMSSNTMVSVSPGRSRSVSAAESSGASSAAFVASSRSGSGRDGIRRIDHLGAEREALEPEAVAGRHDQRRRPFVDVEHESGPSHLVGPLCGVSRPITQVVIEGRAQRGVIGLIFHSTVDHWLAVAARIRAMSGLTATAWPTADSIGRSEWESA